MLKHCISSKTAKIRYSLIFQLIKVVTPSLYLQLKDAPRPVITFLKAHFGNKALVGVEIGVAFGVNALSMCQHLNMKKLFLIDPYLPYEDDNKTVTAYVHAYSTVQRKLLGFNVEFIRKKSEHAINNIPNNLDFVYIDGNHTYEFAKKDLTLYYPKIKNGGVLAGHNFEINYLGVVKAVLEFAEKHGVVLCGDRHSSEFWIVKH